MQFVGNPNVKREIVSCEMEMQAIRNDEKLEISQLYDGKWKCKL